MGSAALRAGDKVTCGGCGEPLVVSTAQAASAAKRWRPARAHYHNRTCQALADKRRRDAAATLLRAAAAAALVGLILAGPALGQVADPRCTEAGAQPYVPPTKVRAGKLPVCTSDLAPEDGPLLSCTYTLATTPPQTVTLSSPQPGSRYLLDVELRRGVSVPYTATCANEWGVSEVAEGVARFPAPPPVILLRREAP